MSQADSGILVCLAPESRCCFCWRCLSSIYTVPEKAEGLSSDILSTWKCLREAFRAYKKQRTRRCLKSHPFPHSAALLTALRRYISRAHSWGCGSREGLSSHIADGDGSGSSALSARSTFSSSLGFCVFFCVMELTPHFPDPKRELDLICVTKQCVWDWEPSWAWSYLAFFKLLHFLLMSKY